MHLPTVYPAAVVQDYNRSPFGERKEAIAGGLPRVANDLNLQLYPTAVQLVRVIPISIFAEQLHISHPMAVGID